MRELSWTGMVFIILSLSISIFGILTHRIVIQFAALFFFLGVLILIRRAAR